VELFIERMLRAHKEGIYEEFLGNAWKY